MKKNVKLYLYMKFESNISLILMQEHFSALYVFTVQINGGVATPPLRVDFEDLPYPRERPYTPFLHQNNRKGYPDSY